MIRFTHVKYGILIAMIAILFGGSMGISFGCCEDDVKGFLNSQYDGIQENKDKVVKKSWVYMKRAHLHSQTMGVIAIAFSLLAAWFNFHPKIQVGVSLLSGIGSLGYGVFWLAAASLAPSMGSTHAAKEAVGLLAQFSGASFLLAGITMFSGLIYIMFIKKDNQ